MTGLSQKLSKNLAKKLGAQIEHVSPVEGGCISTAAIIVLSDDKRFFLKWNGEAPPGFFEAEAEGLRELGAAGAIKVPQVIAYDDAPADGAAYIVLEELLPGEQSRGAEEQLGLRLAALHKTQRAAFGLPADNFIGSLQQKNTPQFRLTEKSFGEFFVAKRLWVQAELGRRNGWFVSDYETLLSEKEQKICEILNDDAEPPSLIHGDLWSGNVFWSSVGPALIDPAVYYGSREADIAFLEHWGGRMERFFAAYNEVWPLRPGFEVRKEVLNLYHKMTHSNLFGGHYIEAVKSVLSAI